MALSLNFTVGTLSVAAGEPRVEGNRKGIITNVTFDTSYPTGGYLLTSAQFLLLQALDTVNVLSGALDQTGTWLVSYNQATSKLMLWTAVGAQVANTTNVSAGSCVIEVIGN